MRPPRSRTKGTFRSRRPRLLPHIAPPHLFPLQILFWSFVLCQSGGSTSDKNKSLYHRQRDTARANFNRASKTPDFTQNRFLLRKSEPSTDTRNFNRNCQEKLYISGKFPSFDIKQACYSFPSFTKTLSWSYILKAKKKKKFYHNFRVSSQK